MPTALDRFNTMLGAESDNLPHIGLWLNQFDSQSFLQSNQVSVDYLRTRVRTDLQPQPSFYLVKFGGDWGGMWGNDEIYAALASGPVIPYLYVKPENGPLNTKMVLHLFDLGFRMVVLDAEQEWAGNESSLYSLLTSIDMEKNLVGVSGYAWFNTALWPDGGKAFGKAVSAVDTLYFPQVYMADWPNNTDQGMAESTRYCNDLFGNTPTVPAFDNTAQMLRGKFGREYTTYTVWEAQQIQAALWQTSAALVPEPTTPETGMTVSEQINTALGQGLVYSKTLNDSLSTIESMLSAHQITFKPLHDLTAAIEQCFHTARKLNGGE